MRDLNFQIQEFYQNDGYGQINIDHGWTIETWNEPTPEGLINIYLVDPNNTFTNEIIFSWSGIAGTLMDSIPESEFNTIILSWLSSHKTTVASL